VNPVNMFNSLIKVLTGGKCVSVRTARGAGLHSSHYAKKNVKNEDLAPVFSVLSFDAVR